MSGSHISSSHIPIVHAPARSEVGTRSRRGDSQLVGFNLHSDDSSVSVEMILAFGDCSRKITNKGYDVFDTPALALSHPLHDPDETIDEEEKTHQSTPDDAQETRHDAEDTELEVVPERVPQEEVNHSATFNPTGNYRPSPPFERSLIDLGRLMVEEGFDLSTYTQVQGLLSEDWKFV